VRKLFFWLHLSAGVIAGLIILIMSLTGVLLTFERQIVAFNEREARAVPVAAAQRLPMSQLIAAARANGGGTKPLSAITIGSAPDAPVDVAFGRELTLLVDPWNGKVLGEGAKKTTAFFRTIEDVHRALAMKGPSRDKGRAITGAANLLFLLIVLSGPILWWPRRWTRSIVRNATWFRGGLSGRARDFNWHNVLGLWSVLPLIAIVASGVVMSYPWANRLVYRLAGSEPPPPPSAAPAQGQARADRGERSRPNDAAYDAVWPNAVTEATRRQGDWKMISARMPFAGGTATFTVDSGNGARPDKRSSLKLDAATGAVKEWQPYAAQEAGRKARTWLRWIHTGEAGGILGQLVAGLASAAAVGLLLSMT
jgi:uncharacterized iron-regulated membrane protein